MGPQQILRAAGLVALAASTAIAAPRKLHERAAVIDLGPPGASDAAVREQLQQALVASGLDPVIGDGIEDALAGVSGERDAAQLAAALGDAKQAFGELKCKEARAAADTAIALAAARQAAGLAVPELSRAWTYVLLCADRGGDTDAAALAATRLRGLGATADLDASLLARYPDIDALSNAEQIAIDVQAEVPGAALWVDFAPAGASPQHLVLPAGRHVIAAASGSRRGVVTGTVVKTQPVVAIAMPEQAGAHADIAARVASWHGRLPGPEELGWVLAQVHARAALVRYGDVVEAWGRAGLAEKPRRLGNDDGTGTVADAPRLAALIVDRVHGWIDHAPDPDVPLLTEDTGGRKGPHGEAEAPTKWWVYAVVIGALAVGTAVIIAHDEESDTQRVTLHFP